MNRLIISLPCECKRAAYVLVAAFLTLIAATCPAQTGATVQFKKLAYSVKEGAGMAVLVVERLGSTNDEASVGFQTSDQDANGGADYMATNGMITFPPGVRLMNLNIAIFQDFTEEPDEKFTVDLVDLLIPGVSMGGQLNATVTIIDDDTCGYVLFPTSRTHGSSAVSSNLLVQATNGCPWTATASVAWIQPISGFSGSSSSVVQYSVDENTSHSPRTGKISVAGKAFTITQLGAPPQDFTPPTVTFSTPAAGTRLTNTTDVLVTGRAIDKGTGMVTVVEFRLENAAGTNDYQFASGDTNWSANVTGLIPGTNTVRVRAKDGAENIGNAVTRSFVAVSASVLTVQTNGAGKVSPLLNGQMLEVGRAYTLTAKPPARNFFVGWSGDLVTNAAKLVFKMQSNLVLQANFVTNPFVATKGSYNGLFYAEDSVRHDNSGFFKAAVAESGAFSARATLAGKSVSFSGRLGLDGKFTNIFSRPNTSALTLHLSLDITGDSAQLTGDLSDGNFLSGIVTDRAKTRGATNFNGTYTLVLPGTNNPAFGPGGDSVGTLTVKAGNLSFVGSLADGTPVTQNIPLSQDGNWPFFQLLYSKGGSMLGWIGFTNRLEDDLHGDVSWIKPVFVKSRYYSNGFPYRMTATGSRYQSSASPILNFTDATLGFAGGNLIEAFTNDVVLTNATKLLNSSDNKLTFTLTKGNGSFSGTVIDPNTGKKGSYKGVLHQKGAYGAGFMPGTNETSVVRLQGSP